LATANYRQALKNKTEGNINAITKHKKTTEHASNVQKVRVSAGRKEAIINSKREKCQKNSL
jgi:hypothetical protein